MLKVFILFSLLSFSVSSFASGTTCLDDDYTPEQARNHATENNLESIDVTNVAGEVTAYLLINKSSERTVEAMYFCNAITDLYYGDSKLSDWTRGEEGDVISISRLEQPILSQDEGLLTLDAVVLSKTDTQVKLRLMYLLFNLAEMDVDARGDLYVTLPLK